MVKEVCISAFNKKNIERCLLKKLHIDLIGVRFAVKIMIIIQVGSGHRCYSHPQDH